MNELERLVQEYPHLPRRSYRVLGLDVSPQFHADQMAILSRPDRRVLIEHHGRVVAAVGYEHRRFESEILGANSVALTPVYTVDDVDRAEVVSEALTAMTEVLRSRDVQMMVLHADTEDSGLLAGAQDASFRVYDTTTSWVIVPGEQTPDLDVDGYRVEILDGDQAAELSDAAVGRLLREAGPAFRNTHLHADPRVDSRLAEEVYRRWGENTVRGRWYDHIITVWRGDEVAGILGWRCKPYAGVDGEVKVWGESFGWRLPDAPGVGKAFHRAVVGALGGDVIEGVTQISNPLIYVLARGGHFRAILSHYVMHGWTD